MNFFCFFFSSRRRHTRWPRDWSSDVCSSDLRERAREDLAREVLGVARLAEPVEEVAVDAVDVLVVQLGERGAVAAARALDHVGDRPPCDRSLGCGEGRHLSARDLYRHPAVPSSVMYCALAVHDHGRAGGSRQGGGRTKRVAAAFAVGRAPYGVRACPSSVLVLVGQQYFFFANAIQPE